MNRRNFINKSAALILAGGTMSQTSLASAATSLSTLDTTATAAKRNKGRIGFQLFGIRGLMKDDVVGSLKKLSDIGYSSVETFGQFNDKFFGYTMKELDNIVKDMGMSISGGHYQGWQMLPEDTGMPEWNNLKYCISELKSAGAKWVVQASMPGGEPKSMDGVKRVAEHFNRVGELCKKAGMKFAFHNHPPDFKEMEGVRIFDYLIKNTDPKLVSYQFDCGNIINVGVDCIQYLRQFPGRFPLWHPTDYDAANRQSRLAGQGDVPFTEMFAQAKSLGLEDLTAELHTGGDSFESCQITFDYLKQFKWTKV